MIKSTWYAPICSQLSKKKSLNASGSSLILAEAKLSLPQCSREVCTVFLVMVFCEETARCKGLTESCVVCADE